MSDEEAPVKPGDVLAGKYEVEKVLGVGGMGVVVAATHLQLKDKVAIKFLLPQVTESPEHVARFLREAQAAVRIKSLHVARVIDVGVLDTGSPYMVMEYLDGRDLAALVADQARLPVEDALTYVLQACEAIAEAHAMGIVHRDLKPANLFLTRTADGSPCIKVLDFGISKNTRPGVDNLTRTQSVIGSPLYMSPEQMRSARSVDARADVWSIGVMLYELIVGEVPFVAESMPQLVALVLEASAPKLREMLPDVPEAVEAIVARCLEGKPEQRYQSVGELAADLAAVLGTDEARVSAAKIARVLEGGSTRVQGTGQHATLPPVATPPRADALTAPGTTLGTTGQPVVEPETKKKPLALVVGGAVALAAILGGAAFAFGGAKNEAPTAPVAPAAAPAPSHDVAPSASVSAAAAPVASVAEIASASATASASASATAPAAKTNAAPRATIAPPPARTVAPRPTTTVAPKPTDKALTPDLWDRKG